MKIKLVSDVHTEFDTDSSKFLDTVPNEGVDVLVVAGDLSTGFKKRIKPNIKQLCDRFPHVIYVLGNHDHWNSTMTEKHEQLARLDAKIDNFHWLENKRIEIDGKFFVGACGWFPRTSAADRLNWIDFRMIKSEPDKPSIDAVFEAHMKTREFLNREVKEGDIVITHHLPSERCVAPEWRNTRSNCWFVAGFDEVIKNNKPEFWLFGHTHTPMHLSFDGCEFFCNPRGYPGEVDNFDIDLIIDTELGKEYES